MLFGILGSVLYGISFPVAMNIFGDIANAFISHDSSMNLVSLSVAPCPGATLSSSTQTSPVIQNFSALVGGPDVVNCSGVFTYINPSSPAIFCAKFTLDDVLKESFSTMTTCLNNKLFIDEINKQIYIFIGIAIGALLVAMLGVWLFQTAAERQVHRIRLSYYKAILRQDIAWFDSNPTGEVASRLSKLVTYLLNILYGLIKGQVPLKVEKKRRFTPLSSTDSTEKCPYIL